VITGRRILSISPFIPQPFIHGAITRIYHLNKCLAARNRLYFACRSDAAETPLGFPAESLQHGTTRISQLVSLPFLHRCLRIISRAGIDMIFANHIWSGLHGMILSKITRIPLVFDNHNIEYVRFRRTGMRIWPLIRVLERTICSAAQTVLCVSETDRDGLMRGLGLPPEKIQVVENGVNIEALSVTVPDEHRKMPATGPGSREMRFLFCGSFTYRPNLDAVGIILREIHPRLVRRGQTGRLDLVGKGLPNLPELERSLDTPLPIKAPGYVDDLATRIRGADVLLAPIQSGSGTRLKILESLACGTPVVTTHMGAEGLDLAACGDNLALSDDWDEFTDMVISKAHVLPAEIPRAFEEKYNWRNIADRIDCGS